MRKYWFKYKIPGQQEYQKMEAKSTNHVKRVLKLRDPSLKLEDIEVKSCQGTENGYSIFPKKLWELGT